MSTETTSTAVETQLKKNEFIPFLDTSGTYTDTWVPAWKRIDRSTIFELGANPEEETKDYISYENPSTVITKYSPELPQEIELYENNPIYDFMFDFLFNLPTGQSAMLPVLMCFGGTDKKAWQNIATISLGSLNTVDGKLTFTIKFGGNIERGTYVVTDGVPVFTADD